MGTGTDRRRGRARMGVLACLAAGLLLAALWVWVQESGGSRQPDVPSSVRDSTAVGATASTRNATLPDAALAPMGFLTTAADQLAAAVAADGDTVILRGRVLWRGGAPASGVRWKLSAGAGYFDPWHGPAREWVDQTGSTDDVGRFSIEFVPPPSYEFYLHLLDEKSPWGYWWWWNLGPGQVIDLADVVLDEGGTVSIGVKDAEGHPIAPGSRWQAQLRPEPYVSGPPNTFTPNLYLQRPDADGRFTFHHVPAAPFAASVQIRTAGWFSSAPFTVSSGGTQQIDVVYPGPPLDRRIYLDIDGEAGRPFIAPGRGMVRLEGPGIEPRMPTTIGGYVGLVFDDLPVADYTLTIDDGLHEVWSRTGVRPGLDVVQATLVGNAAIELAVVDAATGAPIEAFALFGGCRAGDRSSAFTGEHGILLSAMSPKTDAVLVLDRLTPGDYELAVESPGYETTTTRIERLEPRSTRAVTIAMPRTATIPGVVVDGSGQPLADVAVGAFERAEVDDSEDSPYLSLIDYWNVFPNDRHRIERHTTRTGASGRFALDVPEGEWIVRAYRSSAVGVTASGIVAQSGKVSDDLRLELSTGRFLNGRLVVPAGRHCERMIAAVRPASGGEGQFIPPAASADVDPEGRFRLGPLPPGEFEVLLSIDNTRAPRVGAVLPKVGYPGPRVLGRATLSPDADSEVEFDLGASFPGSIVVRAWINGEIAAGSTVCAVTADERRTDLGGAQVPMDGPARIGPIHPGPVDVVLVDFREQWYVFADEPVDVRPGEDVEVEIHAQLAPGTLTVVDATSGAPLAGRPVCIHVDAFGQAPRILRADEHGQVSLRLPPCQPSIHLRDIEEAGDDEQLMPILMFVRGEPSTPRRTVDWTATGPATTTLRLEP